MKREAMAYTMNAPYKDQPAIPSDLYFMGIVEGCHQNGISSRSVTDALKRTRQEVGKKIGSLFYGDRGRLPSEWDFQPICDRCAKAYKTGSGKEKSQSQENRSQQITKPQGKASAVFLSKKGECKEEQKYQNTTCSLWAHTAYGA